jgi:hypothetical protein
MSYIIKNNNPILNIKITDVGRYKLASGTLNYKFFALGDSEINYNYPTPSGLNILKPKDNNPDIKYPLIPNESDPTNFFKTIDYQYVDKNIITNTAKNRGFFTGSSFNTISLYKQILNANSREFTNTLTISATTATTGNAYIPVRNDLILISFSGETSVTTSVPYLWYRITGVTGTIGANFTMSLDRSLPKLNTFPNTRVRIFVYPSGDSITNYYGLNTPTAYWDSGNLNLSGTCTLSQYDVPVWNLSIVWNKNPMGYNTGYGPYKTDVYKGSLSLLNNYPNNLENMGIIHYTNNSVGNEYGEFITKTKFSFPTLMYHRSNVIGHTFTANTEDKYFTNEIETNIPTINTPNLRITGFTNVGVAKMLSGYTFYVSALTDRGETLTDKKFYYKKDGYLFDKTTFGIGYNTGSENTSVVLSWSGITNATGYNLYSRKNYSFSGVTTGNYGDGRGNVSIFDMTDSVPFNPGDRVIITTFTGSTAIDNEFTLLNITKPGGTGLRGSINVGFNLLNSAQTANGVISLVNDTRKIILDKDTLSYTFLDNDFLNISTPLGLFNLPTGNTTGFTGRTVNSDFSLRYYDLVDTIDGYNVGKVFPDLKVAIMEDKEINAALSYKSNRNWTLPTPILTESIVDPCGEDIIGILSATTEQLWVSYMLGSSTGFTTALPCLNYSTITPSKNEQTDIFLSFPIGGFGFLSNFSNFTGYTADRLYVLLKKTMSGDTYNSAGWTIYDITSSVRNQSVGFPIIGSNLSSSKIRLSWSALTYGSQFNIVNYMSGNTTTSSLQLGDEEFLFGNVSTDIGATVYQTNLLCVVDETMFNRSVNPTFNVFTGTPYISEVGIYSDDKDLVGIAKLATPVIKSRQNSTIYQINLDF